METQIKTNNETNEERTVRQTITPFLWFNDNAETAVNFYTSLFKNSAILKMIRYGDKGAEIAARPEGSVMTVDFQLEGQAFAAINGGPIFEINPAISFFVSCDTPQEIDILWERLSDGGTVMMELDNYPFSEKYGWIQDRFGVSWQLILQGRAQKIAPCFMFAGVQHKKAEEALNFYVSVFADAVVPTGRSEIMYQEHYKAGQGPEGAVVHSRFTLGGLEFVAMDSHMQQDINFSPAVSLAVNCETQEEIDYYWDRLTEGGDVSAQQCGWLQDKYGVSWQVVPSIIGSLMSDPIKSQRVMQALFPMKKLDIETLINAL
jgi:predicted 3-demethylubiquinone-9 3-methyltransferase (glyoxalase superfamily)